MYISYNIFTLQLTELHFVVLWQHNQLSSGSGNLGERNRAALGTSRKETSIRYPGPTTIGGSGGANTVHRESQKTTPDEVEDSSRQR